MCDHILSIPWLILTFPSSDSSQSFEPSDDSEDEERVVGLTDDEDGDDFHENMENEPPVRMMPPMFVAS